MHLLQALCDRDKRKRKKGKALPHKLYFCLISELLKLISPPFLLHETKYVKKKKKKSDIVLLASVVKSCTKSLPIYSRTG